MEQDDIIIENPATPFNFAFVNEHGLIKCIMSPALDTDFTHGESYTNGIAIAIPLSESLSSYYDKWYDLSTGEWKDMPSKPNPFCDWINGEWVLDPQKLFTEIRRHRDSRLFLSDWTQAVDAPLTEEQKEAWRVYRQELRDITNAYSYIVDYDE